MTTISILRYANGELESADTATLTIENTAAVVIVGPETVLPVSEGTYTYDVSALTPGTYTAIWTFVSSLAATVTVNRVFVIDAPVSLTSGILLMDIERSLSGRLGGTYRRFWATGGSTINGVISTRLQSSVPVGDFEDLYVLRRGVMRDGSRVEDYDEDDRVRMVSEYDYASGTLHVDQSYAVAPLTDEMIELHYLEPEFELRPSVLDGLQRCYFWDTVQIDSTAPYGTINLTSVIPWLSNPAQIQGAAAKGLNSRFPSTRLPWSRAYRVGPSIYLDTENTMPGTLDLMVLRPVGSLVNDEMSLAGPNDDFDLLAVELEYAVRAAHVAAWIRHPERLTPIAAQGMGIPLSMAAQAFSVRSLAIVGYQPEFPQVRFGQSSGDIVLGNAPEPVI